MSSVFIVAGEASGDLVGGWFVQHKLPYLVPSATRIEGIGGEELEKSGVKLYASYKLFNVVGFFEILRRIPYFLRKIDEVAAYISEQHFSHVVLVDFGGFNLRLGKRLRQKNPSLNIIYVAPPQFWCWGEWRLKSLQSFVNEIVVLFPFEVGWYKARDMAVHYFGNPVVERIVAVRDEQITPVFKLGVFPGSRGQEIKAFLPFLREVIRNLREKWPALEVEVFQAPSIAPQVLNSLVEICPARIRIVPPEKRWGAMQECAVALTKAGTTTLELALLRIPTVIFYKAHWITYGLARLLVSVKRMGLPNIIVDQDLMPELIQQNCTPSKLAQAVGELLSLYEKKQESYKEECKRLGIVEAAFRSNLKGVL